MKVAALPVHPAGIEPEPAETVDMADMAKAAKTAARLPAPLSLVPAAPLWGDRPAASPGDWRSPLPSPPGKSLKELEREFLLRVLAENRGNKSAAAKALQMHRRTLQRKLSRGA